MAKQTETKVITNPVRLSYVHLLEPEAFEGQDPKYSVQLLIPKTDTETLDAIKKAQQIAYDGAKDNKLKGVKPNMLKTTLRDADKELDTEENPAAKGTMFINVSSKMKPGIVSTQRGEDGKRKVIDDPDEVYSGMYGAVAINFYAFNTAGNKGISGGLNNVMKTADGDHLGGKASAESDFDDWEDDDAEDDGLLD